MHLDSFVLIALVLCVLVQYYEIQGLKAYNDQMDPIRRREMAKTNEALQRSQVAMEKAISARLAALSVAERQGRLRTKVAGLQRDLALSGAFITKGEDK